MNRKHSRTTQHKQEREERKSKELQDLKRENDKLEKQVARLRKQLAKTITESENAEEEAQEDNVMMKPTVKLPVCECGGTSLKEIVMGSKTYRYCSTCKKRIE